MPLLSAILPPFIPAWDQLRAFSADLWLIATIVAVLLTPFFARKPNRACAVVTLVGLGLALVSLVVVWEGGVASGPYLRGLLTYDSFAASWKALLLVFVIGIVVLWFAATSWSMHEGDGPEFFTLLLGATLGMSLMGSTSNLLMLVLSIELASLPSYVLAGFRKTHRVGAEASLKYVLFGAAASSILIYGLSMLYGLYGTLQVDGPEGLAAKMATSSTAGGALLAVAVFGLVVGVGFKVSAVPFHFWCPDVFEGAGVEVGAFLSVASKGAALALLLRVLMLIADAFGYQGVAGHVSLSGIAGVIGVIGAVTCTVGNTAAYVQTNVKRLLAYSSIAQAGYMLCALSLLVNHAGNRVTLGGVNQPAQAILVYLAAYVFMNLGAFAVAALVWRQTNGETLEAYAGLGRRSPWLAACMFCFMVSLIGLPPFGGFLAKLNLMWVLAQNGGAWWWLVAVIGVNTVISAFYYFRVIRAMYLTPSDGAAFRPNGLGLSLVAACAVGLLVMFAAYNPLTKAAAKGSRLAGVGGVGTESYAPAASIVAPASAEGP